MKQNRSTRAPLRAALSWLGLAAACALRSPLEWPSVLADVRATYPGVRHISVEELRRELASDAAPLLLDVRSVEEFRQSHLASASVAPDRDAALIHIEGLPRERAIVVYCSVGMRSSALAVELREAGFTHVSNLEGGIFAWANAGHPTYRGEQREDRVHPFNARWGALLAAERRVE